MVLFSLYPFSPLRREGCYGTDVSNCQAFVLVCLSPCPVFMLTLLMTLFELSVRGSAPSPEVIGRLAL